MIACLMVTTGIIFIVVTIIWFIVFRDAKKHNPMAICVNKYAFNNAMGLAGYYLKIFLIYWHREYCVVLIEK